jgi:hypothetical protein|tara:strand:+ start:293 stop:835 length:543 start_codon:yes stop_codon:yes gene_type:complete
MIEKLVKVQNELKAPKSQFNSFGKYKYRNAEDIFEAAKPICYKYGLFLSISDAVIEVGGQLFVESSATITDGEKSIQVKAQAGLDMNRKGMDKAQSSGASSSYARKYALGGMFLLDDTKDADATNTHGKSNTTTAKATLVENSEAYLKVVTALKSGKFNLAQVEAKYIISNELKTKLQNN